MVRLPALRAGHRAGFRQTFFPSIGSDRRRVAGVRGLFRRISRPAYGGCDIRPLGRPDRAQGNLDRDIARDRYCHYGSWSRADLRVDRHLGAFVLVIIRLIQGIGVGGEWGGSVLLAMEW